MAAHCRRLRLSFAAMAFLLLASSSASPLQYSAGASKTPVDRLLLERRQLARLGSSPPSCKSKCGRCSPCKLVRVPVRSGVSVPLDYYPEAWRCKCGNKLFMPS